MWIFTSGETNVSRPDNDWIIVRSDLDLRRSSLENLLFQAPSFDLSNFSSNLLFIPPSLFLLHHILVFLFISVSHTTYLLSTVLLSHSKPISIFLTLICKYSFISLHSFSFSYLFISIHSPYYQFHFNCIPCTQTKFAFHNFGSAFFPWA
jgi:hypothetical protein